MNTENKDLWNKNKWVLYVILALFAAWLLHKCNNSAPDTGTKTVKVEVKTAEVTGEFPAKKPDHQPITATVKTAGNTERSGVKIVENPINKELKKEIQRILSENKRMAENFSRQTDSLKQQLYEKAIQPKAFNVPFEDDNIKIDMSGIVQGEVKSIKPKYTWKEKTVTVDAPVKEKQRVFALKTGAEYGNTLLLDKGVFKGNLEFENKKGNSYNIGYDTDERIWLGAKFTVFDIKK